MLSIPKTTEASRDALLERAVKAESALRSVRALAEESLFGGWRFKVAAIVDKALAK